MMQWAARAITRRRHRRQVAAQIRWGHDYIRRTYGGYPVTARRFR